MVGVTDLGGIRGLLFAVMPQVEGLVLLFSLFVIAITHFLKFDLIICDFLLWCLNGLNLY